MVTRLGIIGLSKGNGHPFSFSAIVNGYDPSKFAQCEWQGIFNYLKKANPSEIGLEGMTISHVWTQDRDISKQIAQCCLIEHIVGKSDEMLGAIDALIIARDDAETHLPLAKQFLDAGTPVFIDKPLTLHQDELEYFKPFLEAGNLMSTSGLRYCTELDVFRTEKENKIGELITIQCAVVNGWQKYGIHMIDVIQGVYPELTYESIKKVGEKAESFQINCSGGESIQIHCLGENAPVFYIAFIGTKGVAEFRITNNFGAFRRTLLNFQKQILEKKPIINPKLTIAAMELLRAGNKAELSQKILL